MKNQNQRKSTQRTINQVKVYTMLSELMTYRGYTPTAENITRTYVKHCAKTKWYCPEHLLMVQNFFLGQQTKENTRAAYQYIKKLWTCYGVGTIVVANQMAKKG